MKTNLSLSANGNDNWKEKAGRIGHYAKGIVYTLAGILTLLSSLNMGGQKAGKTQVIDFLQKQPFGNVILILMALGLGCYAFWRFLEAIQDLRSKGNDYKGLATRASYFFSGVIYLVFGMYVISQLFAGGSSSGQSSQGYVARLLNSDTGTIIVILIAVGFFIKALLQLVKAYKGNFADNIRTGNKKAAVLVKNAGYAGYVSRALLIGIIGYFFLQAAMQSNAGHVQGSSGAFGFIQQSGSWAWLMGVVAFGLLCYGIFMILLARYARFSA